MNTAEAVEARTKSVPATVNVYLDSKVRWTREGLLALIEKMEASIKKVGVSSISIRSADAKDFCKGQRHWSPSIFFFRKNINPEKTIIAETNALLADKLDREVPLVVQCIFDAAGEVALQAVDQIRMIPDIGKAKIEIYDIFTQGRGLSE